jgi:hypothetical protein
VAATRVAAATGLHDARQSIVQPDELRILARAWSLVGTRALVGARLLLSVSHRVVSISASAQGLFSLAAALAV